MRTLCSALLALMSLIGAQVPVLAEPSYEEAKYIGQLSSWGGVVTSAAEPIANHLDNKSLRSGEWSEELLPLLGTFRVVADEVSEFDAPDTLDQVHQNFIDATELMAVSADDMSVALLVGDESGFLASGPGFVDGLMLVITSFDAANTFLDDCLSTATACEPATVGAPEQGTSEEQSPESSSTSPNDAVIAAPGQTLTSEDWSISLAEAEKSDVLVGESTLYIIYVTLNVQNNTDDQVRFGRPDMTFEVVSSDGRSYEDDLFISSSYRVSMGESEWPSLPGVSEPRYVAFEIPEANPNVYPDPPGRWVLVIHDGGTDYFLELGF